MLITIRFGFRVWFNDENRGFNSKSPPGVLSTLAMFQQLRLGLRKQLQCEALSNKYHVAASEKQERYNPERGHNDHLGVAV